MSKADITEKQLKKLQLLSAAAEEYYKSAMIDLKKLNKSVIKLSNYLDQIRRKNNLREFE